MRDRVAWAQVNFGLIGDDIEMVGSKRGPMAILEKDKRRESRSAIFADLIWVILTVQSVIGF